MGRKIIKPKKKRSKKVRVISNKAIRYIRRRKKSKKELSKKAVFSYRS